MPTASERRRIFRRVGWARIGSMLIDVVILGATVGASAATLDVTAVRSSRSGIDLQRRS